jgi:transposase
MKKGFDPMSYKGKTICVGIDVHKKTYSVVAVVEGEVVKKWTTKADSESFADHLLRYFAQANIKTVYEAGFSGFVLHRDLEKAGHQSIVVNPASIEVAVNNRVKTDKRDALKMANLLEAGRLKGIRIPSEQEEQQRLLTRTREQLVEQRTSIKNQIRMKFHQMGLIDIEDTRSMSHKLVSELLSKSKSNQLHLVVNA